MLAVTLIITLIGVILMAIGAHVRAPVRTLAVDLVSATGP